MNCGHGGINKLFLQFIKGICYDCAEELLGKTGECYLCRKVYY